MSDPSELPALLRQNLIRIPQGAWRGADLFSPSHDHLAWAERGQLYLPNGGPIATLRRQRRGDDGFRVWVVEDAAGHEVGTIVPESRVNWRGKRRPIDSGKPLQWAGAVRLTGLSGDIALIRGGALFEFGGPRIDSRRIAVVRLGDKRWFGSQSMWGEWTLEFYDCADPLMRVMCFGWLNLAWKLQRALDNSD